MSFIFSADGHVTEPPGLLTDSLPEKMRVHGIRTEVRDNYRCTMVGDRMIHRARIVEIPKPVQEGEGTLSGMETWRRVGEGEKPLRKVLGANNIEGRLVDMKADGIDAEIAFPSTAMFSFGITDIDTEMATAQTYNDWNNRFFAGHTDRFVRCGVLPVRDFRNTEIELKRLAGLGYTAAMLPVVTSLGLPKYNDEAWDPVFHLAGELGVALVLHTATGLEHIVHERGPGGAVINYARQLNDGADAVMYLAAGGVLDRNPKARVAIIEAGASWLPAVAERMDEVYNAHYSMVRPKLSRMPSQIVRDQIKCSFQSDRACIIARDVVGAGAVMWGSDYPHAEGTFPNSQMYIDKLFNGIDISEADKADILGLNAARLFRLPRPELAAP